MADYKDTLNLPKTSFPMKANLSQKEPETLKYWDEVQAYEEMISASGSKGAFVLHDGPPYANGNIHLGTALNKILKDIIVKSKNMQGYKSQYVPGWDCHGLPIEHKIELQLGEKKDKVPAHVVRKLCREYAQKYLNIQRKEFIRLGVLGTWEKPYMSMDPAYEAATSRELANFVEKGSLVRSKKPIYWCASCKTALAEAEVEYHDHTSSSVYVSFPFKDTKLKNIFEKADPENAFIIIWTTTPWTLPNNMAVALHPEFDYALVAHKGKQYILASELVEQSAKIFAWDEYEILGTAKGKELENLEAKHPFYDRKSPIVLGDHVTLDAGVGAVHTAPGHGREDYEVGLKYGLEIYSPLNDEARYYETVEFFKGLTVFEANPLVIEKLKEVGNLLYTNQISHSYPHCWRCKSPVIFRATTQWFISMEKNELRNKSLKAIRNDVKWIPSWGEDRIYNMIESRPDWCISRQRMWGVPILALLCEDCGEAWNDPSWMREISDRFAKHETGCDYWYETELSDILPQDLKCPHCNGNHWKKETDILDVWFDSGTSFAAVVEQRDELTFPADLYLEGSDQHRGWFHSSLLASVGTRDCPPYKQVLTHGYVVDKDARKMSKSVGNVVAPQDIMTKYGADILRLWVSSSDYTEDIRISDEILARLTEAYRRIRNTCRYLLGSISDLTNDNLVSLEKLLPVDRYMLDVMVNAHNNLQQAYTDYEFHKVYHTLHGLCVTELSSFYLDGLKDRLYASLPDSLERRSAQTVLFEILILLIRDMAPVLSFTAEETLKYLPEALRPQVKTVFALPEYKDVPRLSKEELEDWEKILFIRSEITKAIEPLRKEGIIGHSLDTSIDIYLDEALIKMIEEKQIDMREISIVSQLHFKPYNTKPAELADMSENLAILVEKAKGEKCERCWIYTEEAGTDSNYPTLCPRCSKVMKALDNA